MEMSSKLTAFLIAKNIVPMDEKEIYEYGFELLIADTVNFSIIILTSAFMQDVWTGVIYLICFVTTRSFCGGFHAKTHAMCRIAMFTSYILFIALHSVLTVADCKMLLCGTLLAWIPVIVFAPVVHGNKPICKALRLLNRRRAFGIYAFWSVTSLLLVAGNKQAGVTIILTLWIVSLCMILAIFLTYAERRWFNEEV